jgi:hypothetical protein
MPGIHRAADALSLCGHLSIQTHRSGARGEMDPGTKWRDDKGRCESRTRHTLAEVLHHAISDSRANGRGCDPITPIRALGTMDPGTKCRDDRKSARIHHGARMGADREAESAAKLSPASGARLCCPPSRPTRGVAFRGGIPGRGRVAGMLWANAVRSVRLEHRGRGATPRCPE